MVVLNVNGNSMFDVYKMKLLDVAKAIKPGPNENEVVDQSQQKDNSFDDFEDVNDDMLATVYQLVAQYEKMGGKLRTDGAKMIKGGAKKMKYVKGSNMFKVLSDSDDSDDSDNSDDSDASDDEPINLTPQKPKVSQTPDDLLTTPPQVNIGDINYKEEIDLNKDNRILVKDLKALNTKYKVLEQDKDFWTGKLTYIKKLKQSEVDNDVREDVLLELDTLERIISDKMEKTPIKKTNVVVPSNSLEKELGIKLGNKAADGPAVEKKLVGILAKIKAKKEDSNHWKALKLKMEALYEIEKNDTTKSLKRPRTGVTDVFNRIYTELDNKIALSMQSEQSQQQTAEAESKAEQAESKVEETEQELNAAKSLFSETGNTSLSALLSLIVKVINKMVRLVKLRKYEWPNYVPMMDLNDVRNKVVEYYNKFNEIDPNDKIMRSYKDSYKLTNKKFDELRDEFEMLVKSSNLNTKIYGGGHRCKFKDEESPFIFPGKM